MSLLDELKRRNVLRVTAAYVGVSWLAIQIVETLAPAFGFGEQVLRLVTIVLGIGLIPTLVFAWAFELTADGVRREQDVDHSAPAARARARRLDRVVMVVLSLALGYFVFDKFVLDPERDAALVETVAEQTRDEMMVAPEPDRSIAVLPFANLTDDPEQAYFSDGVAEELTNLLARIPELRVSARSSAFSMREETLEIPEIAARLNVGHVLAGSVRRAGDQIRVGVQLVEGSSGAQLWSASFDRRFDDIFAVQDEIAAAVVDSLRLTLIDGAPRATVVDPAAYNLYLQAVYLEQQESEESHRKAIGLFLDAIDADPGYATAWAALAAAYANQTAGGNLPWDVGRTKARDAALRAIELDPRNVEGFVQLAWIARLFEGDLAAAADYMEQALALDPTDRVVIGNAAALVLSLGRVEESVALQEYSVARSPVEPAAHYGLSLGYRYADRMAAAEVSGRKVLELSPEYVAGRYSLGETLLLLGRPEEALAVWETESDEAFRVKGRALAYHALGRQKEADAALATLIAGWGEKWPSEIAHVYAYRGEVDAAFEWLAREYALYGAGGWGEWQLQRLYDNLRDEPRWRLFLHRVGASPEQLAAIRFEMPAPAVTDP